MPIVTTAGAVISTADTVDPANVVYIGGIAVRKSDGAMYISNGLNSAQTAALAGFVGYTASGGDDSVAMQTAANTAMAAGVPLRLAAGTYNLNSAGLQANSGVDLGSGAYANQGYKGLEIIGAGAGLTVVNIGGAFSAFRWHTGSLTGNSLNLCGIAEMTIIGTGIAQGSCAIQMGGVSAVRTDLIEGAYIRNIVIDNVTSGIILDDVTNLEYIGLRIKRAKYHWEFGYNCDDIHGYSQYGLNVSNLNGVSTTLSTASNSFTVSATVAGLLQVGYAINFPGYFPAQTYVGSIVGTTITAVDYKGTAVNALANGSIATGIFMLGRVFNYGARLLDTVPGTLYPQYGSPFVSPYWSGSIPAARGRVNANMHLHKGVAGQVERISDIGGASHFDLTFSIYQERTNEGYLIGDAGSSLQARQIHVEKCYVGAPNRMLTPWVYVPVTAGDYEITIRKNTTDASDMAQYWFSCPTYGSAQCLAWEDNNLPSTGIATLMSGGNNALYAATPILGKGQYYYIGSARKGDGIPAKTGNTAWQAYGQDGFAFTISGNTTLSNPADGPYNCTGKSFLVNVTSTGAFNFSFDTQFKKVDGTAFTAIAMTIGQKLGVSFVWDGTYFRAQNTALPI